MKSINHIIINESFGELINSRYDIHRSMEYNAYLFISTLDHRDNLDTLRRSISKPHRLYYLNIYSYA